jgi:hypothetical protein
LILYAIFILSVSYGLGGKPLEEYPFYFGMPSWFFYCAAGMVCFIIALGFICMRVFSEMSVEAYVEEVERDD